MNEGFKETEIGLIPEEWDYLNLGELCKFVTGKLNSNMAEEGGIYPFFTCSPEILSINSYSFDTEAILLAGNNAEGKFNVKYYNGKFDVYQRTYVITIKDLKKLNYSYLYFALILSLDRLRESSQGTATKFLTMKILNAMELPVPRIEEQTKIGQILYDLDKKIELNHEMNRTLEAIGQAIFRHWFVHFEFPNSEGQPYKASGGEMVDSELGEIPKGWEIAKLEDHMDFLEGPGIRNWQYTDEGIPFINIRLINNGEIDLSKANFVSVNEIEKYNHFLLKEKDIIVSTSGTLGRHAVVRKEHLPLLLNTSVIRFRQKSLDYSYMYYYLTSKRFYEELLVHASGSVQLNFGPMHLKRIFFILPPVKIQNEFEAINSQILEKLNQNRSEIFILSKIRDSLLPKLMSGKIRVNISEEATVK
jgi:type I restriction enzyme S subunit